MLRLFMFVNLKRKRKKKEKRDKEGTLYTSRKSLQHLLATGVPSCEEPWSAHEQTCKISREELPDPIKQRRDELRKNHFFVSLPLQCRLLILVDSCAEWGWPDTLGTIQGDLSNNEIHFLINNIATGTKCSDDLNKYLTDSV